MTIVLVFNGNQLSKRSKKEHMVWVCGLYISMHFPTESLILKVFTCDVILDPPPLLVSDILPEARSALSSSMIQMGPISKTMNMSVPKDTLHGKKHYCVCFQN